MNSREKSFLGSLDGHAMAVTVCKKKMQLIEMIRSSDIFDSKTIEDFDLSRNKDGRYKINPGDPVLINNAKSAINIMNSLEILLPHGINPIISIIESEFNESDKTVDNIWDHLKMLRHGASLAFNLGPDYSTILGLVDEANDLSFYLVQLKNTLSTLPVMDSQFLPLISNLKQSISQEIEPLLSQIKMFLPFQLPTASTQQTVTKKRGPANEARFKSVYDNLNPIIENIRNHLMQNGEACVEGVYKIENNMDTQSANLMHAHNAIIGFISALNKVETTLSMKDVYLPSTILMELGRAIIEFEKVDFNSIKELGENALNALDEKLGEVLIELVRNVEYAEICLGLKNEVLQNNLAEIFALYANFSKNKNIKQQQWLERLHIRQNELSKKEQQRDAYKITIKQLERTPYIDDSFSQNDLINLHEMAASLPIQQGQALAESIKSAIYKKTGLDKLQHDIKELEIKALAENDIYVKQILLKDLQSLYQLHKQIESNLSVDEHRVLSYQGNKTALNAGFISIGKVKFNSDAICQAVNELITGADRDIVKLNHVAGQAEIHLLQELNQDYLQTNNNKIYNTIERLSPLDLYKMQPGELNAYIELLEKINSQKCDELKFAFIYAHHQAETIQDIRLLKAAKSAFITDNSLTGFTEEYKQKICDLLGMRNYQDICALIKETNEKFYFILTGRKVVEHPLVEMIDKKIAQMEKENQKTSYKLEEHVIHWEEALQNVLSEMRAATLRSLNFNSVNPPDKLIENNKQMRLAGEIAAAFPVTATIQENLNDDFVIKRQWFDTVLPSMKTAREKIISLLDIELIDEMEKQAFHHSFNLSTHTYAISGNEPLLFRSMKNVLNMLARFEKVCHKLMQINSMRGMLQFKTVVIHELNEFQLEVDDFLFQLNEIKSTGLAMFSSILSDPLERLGELVMPPLAGISSFLNISGIHDLLNTDTRGIGTKLSNAVAIIQNVENSTKIRPILVNEDYNDNKFLRELKENLALVKKLAQDLNTARDSLVKISETGNRLYALPILNNLMDLYEFKKTKIGPKYDHYYEQLTTVLSEPVFKNAISELYIQSELSEARLGLVKGTLSNPIKVLCEQYEKIVYSDNKNLSLASVDERIPYPARRIALFNQEYEANDIKHANIEQTLRLLKNPGAIKSLPDLLLIRKTLSLLPPNKNHYILGYINDSIAKSIGLSTLDEILNEHKHQQALCENEVLKEKSQLDALNIEYMQIEKNIAFLESIQNRIINKRNDNTNNITLTLADITRLQGFYPEHKRPLINHLCHDIIHQPEAITRFITEKFRDLADLHKSITSKIAATQKNYNLHNERYQGMALDLEKHQQPANTLRAMLDNDHLHSDDILYYDKKTSELTAKPLSLDTDMLTNANMDQVIQDLNALSVFTMQRNENLADYVEDLRTKTRLKQEEMNILRDAQAEITAIELAAGLKHDALMTLVFGNDNKRELTAEALEAYKTNKFSGLMKQIQFTNSHDDAFKFKYGFDTRGDDIFKLSAQRSAGSSAIARFFYPVGRFFRRLFGISSHDDLISYMTEHYVKLPADSRKYTAPLEDMHPKKLLTSLTIGGSRAFIHSNLNLDLDLDPAQEPDCDTNAYADMDIKLERIGVHHSIDEDYNEKEHISRKHQI